MGELPRTVIHLPDQGRTLDMGSFRMTVKAEAKDTAGTLSLLEADEPPGFGPPVHIHEDAGEAFYVLAGGYLIFVEDEEHWCPTGSFIYIPRGVRHGFRVGSAQSRKLNIYVPAAMIGYFDALAGATGAGTPLDAAALAEVAAAHSMQVLGDVPDGYVTGRHLDDGSA